MPDHSPAPDPITPAPSSPDSAAQDQAAGAPRPPAAVVGIGGSAGALGGYERFFLSFPVGSGAALVVVPHLGPHHKGLMPELLQRCTALPVLEIEDGMRLQADHVYVIPPGRGLGLMDGMLLLGERGEMPGMPIDAFFESLAADQGERAVAVVLSGAGTDGTRGVTAIKENFGRVFVQDPGTAEYPSMPRSAAATRLADAVLPPEELADQLYAALTQRPAQGDPEEQGGRPDPALQKILLLIRSRTGQDFTGYKKSTLVRRIDRRMKSHRIDRVGQYVRFLQENPREVEALIGDLTINVTSFFRDPEAFEQLAEHLRSYIVMNKADVDTFRVWVAGCSTGEEAYSVAILLHEVLEDLGSSHTLKVQVFATDIDKDAINVARQAVYPERIAYNVSPERLERYFVPRDGGYQVRADIRDTVIFALHNTFGDPPFTRLDLLCCRNLLIYLNAELQKRVLSLFHYALRPGGLLFLGASETAGSGGDRDRFAALSVRWRIYRRGEGEASPLPLAPPPSGQGPGLGEDGARPPLARQRVDPAQLAQNLLLSEYAPPAVVVNGGGEILFVNGRTARYLELQPGRASMNVLEMARDGLRYELPAALREADTERRAVTLRGLHVVADGVDVALDVTVRPLPAGEQNLLLVLFAEQPGEPEAGAAPVTDHAQVLERELKHARETLQATIEEMAVSMEELRSTNEELQAANGELQSTNEELISSKEELQSLNEELITINAEHERVIHDLAQANDDMKNLLDSAGIATVFLDNDLRIKRFTPRITGILNLIGADIARPITDISLNLRYEREDFTRDLRGVLDTLVPFETQVQARDEAWYLMRISPYRRSDNFIDGAVVTFTNIGVVKALEGQVRHTQAYAEAALNALHEPVAVFDGEQRLVAGNRALHDLLGADPAQLQGQRLYNAGNFVLDVPELQQVLRDVTATEEAVVGHLLDLPVPGRGTRKTKVEVKPIISEDGQSAVFLLMLEDVTGLVERAARGGEGVTGDVTREGDG
ncbi:methylase of chemotaxis methyl-accepting protein [Deinococcus aerius]|uniref:protein-glutamate O-methyltransferase n=1 Tax=Deinococcus aerius TaxID=200253 RepID=A0A2I9D044_9DEIO|nr:CheR family methyltransferase [Deinococcus aerius]GBF07872.1 methylase of chemotaxis methyl-accepting protein [Deinococcus aerius]